MTSVNWFEATKYCARLSAQWGMRLRLPTEAEWEFACGGLSKAPYPWGDAPPKTRAVLRRSVASPPRAARPPPGRTLTACSICAKTATNGAATGTPVGAASRPTSVTPTMAPASPRMPKKFLGGIFPFFSLNEVNHRDDCRATVFFVTLAGHFRDKIGPTHGAPDAPTAGRNHAPPARLERR